MKKLLLTMAILTTATTAFANVVIDTIVYEASNQSFEGQVAVASVIKTRMAQRRRTAEQIVLQPKQFSCWVNGKPIQSRTITEKERAIAERAWEKAEVWQYNHYAHYKINNYWTRQAKSSVRIGDHIFYEL